MKLLFLSLFSFLSLFGADIIVCSFNRPLQLYALLESIEQRVTGYDAISVICRSDTEFKDGYKKVEQRFPEVSFYHQPSKKGQAFRSFKTMVRQIVHGEYSTPSKYFLFAMDDIIITDTIDLQAGENLLEKRPDIHGFFYRLGKNVTRHSLPTPGENDIPPLTDLGDDLFCWNFGPNQFDWGYPNSLDFTLYRKSYFVNACKDSSYRNPPDFEWKLCSYSPVNGKGACHSMSKIVNLCINRVSTTTRNPVLRECSVHFLNEQFMKGLKIDIFSIDKQLVNSAHQDVPFNFIQRD
ncbi:MAG: hypothetical protein SP4CHLAM5_04210 [Chlamydiia bacterium]|nr:hypothetical protein [Chlamydiia bacterium]MCH9618294.1 hypothetical protein [Chlamydiia bacterium]MCH9624167.1 hypothetical protein [Chlamydiia bacterium]